MDSKTISMFLIMIMGAFHGILFLQSAHDKMTDWSGNLGWLTGHFEKSIFKNFVPILLGIITIFELLTGLLSWASIYFTYTQNYFVGIIAGFFALITLLQLFIGQRLAKDYAGAGALVPYFIMAFIWLFLIAGQ